MRPILMTAGATRNRVDAIRYLSAHAGGSTALQVVERLVGRLGAGHPIHLLGSEEAVLRARLWVAERGGGGGQGRQGEGQGGQAGLSLEVYEGTRDLMARMERWIVANPEGVIVHSAAVGDYEVDGHVSKIPSGQEEVILRLRPAPKIVDRVRGWAPGCRLVSFKAGRPELTMEELEEIARAQLARTRSDRVFANVIGRLDSTAALVGEAGVERFLTRDQAIDALAALIVGWASEVTA